jgi:hypothetical protein
MRWARIAGLLDTDGQPVVVQADDGAAGQHGDPRLCKLRGKRCRLVRERGRHTGRPAAELRRAIDQQHRPTGLRRRQRRRHAGHAAADHQHIDLFRHLVVAVGIDASRGWRRMAQTGQRADGRLEKVPVRPHEGLVVEAGRQQRREPIVDRRKIQAQRRPRVAVDRAQAGRGVDVGGARVGRARGADAHVEQRARLLDAATEHAARPMQLDAARHDADAGSQQRRGHGVAGAGRYVAAAEAEDERTLAVDPATGWGLESVAAHVSRPPGRPR